jgi:hypothetical protein
LLVLLFAADALLPPPVVSPYFSAPARMPTIRIHSEVKGPEKVAIDTSGFVRPELWTEQVEAPEQAALSSEVIKLEGNPSRLEQAGGRAGGSASRPVAGIREAFAQLASQAEVSPVKQASRRHPSSSGRTGGRKPQLR